MRLTEYLKTKYQVEAPTTMLKREAKAFGIPWPLPERWLIDYGDMHINTEDSIEVVALVGYMRDRWARMDERISCGDNCETAFNRAMRAVELLHIAFKQAKTYDNLRGV
jgi:hypothetical protein